MPRAMDKDGELVTEAMDAYVSRADYPLHVVTTVGADGPSGCVVGVVTQCSIVPPRFVVCLSKLNHTFFASEDTDSAAVHLLGADQVDLASLFAETTGDTVDKLSRCDWRTGTTGSPILVECAAWWEGAVIDRWSVGDHEALLLRPVTGGAGTHDGVLTYQNAPDLRPGHPSM
jgi:flavin reductase (DIM6/NTAB) family NADH-FMN oxidoreductase RutF